jgi:hypothetical protein
MHSLLGNLECPNLNGYSHRLAAFIVDSYKSDKKHGAS